MDSFWVIVLFILFAIFSDKKDKKKPVPRRRVPDLGQRPLPDIPQPRPQKREKIIIPELRGAPPLPEIKTSQQVQAEDAIRAEQERYQEMLRRKKRQERENRETQPVVAAVPQSSPVPVESSGNSLQQAVIWAEILGKPRAYRRK